MTTLISSRGTAQKQDKSNAEIAVRRYCGWNVCAARKGLSCALITSILTTASIIRIIILIVEHLK